MSVDFTGRHRTGDELKKELELFKKGFTRIWQAYNRSGQNESDWHKFISSGNKSVEADFTQKLHVLGYVFDIRYRETDLTFISPIFKLVDDSGDAGEEAGFGVEPSVSVDDDYCQLDTLRKRRSSSGAVTTDMIGPIISQSVADAYTSIVARTGSGKSLSDPKKSSKTGGVVQSLDVRNTNVIGDEMKQLLRRAKVTTHIFKYKKLMTSAETEYEEYLYKRQV